MFPNNELTEFIERDSKDSGYGNKGNEFRMIDVPHFNTADVATADASDAGQVAHGQLQNLTASTNLVTQLPQQLDDIRVDLLVTAFCHVRWEHGKWWPQIGSKYKSPPYMEVFLRKKELLPG